MGKRWQIWSIGLACLAAWAPWAISSTPVDRLPKICDGPCHDRPAVRLDFADHPEKCIVCPAVVDGPLNRTESVKVPTALPGANEPMPVFPKFDPNHAAEYADAIDKLYPPLPALGIVIPPEQGPEGRPITLEDLQHYAEASSPLIRQAAAESAATSPAGFCNLHAILVAQHRHAKAIAAADRELAQLAFTRIEAEVLGGVRRGFFAVLAAQEGMRLQDSNARLADGAYRQTVERAKTGQIAASEPLQLRALAYQSRAALVQARNRYLAAWKQLAATVGRLDLQPAQLAGQIDRPLPIMSFEKLHACVLSRNSEVAAARHELDRAQSVLRSYTAPPFAMFHRAAAARAKSVVARAQEEPEIVRAALTSELAEAFERYDNQRRILAYYRDNIVPDQVRAYRALAARPPAERASVAEAVAAQQALSASVATYLNSLGEAWFAVVDIARLVQSRDLFVGDAVCGSQLASLDLPSCRPGPSAMNWPDVIPSNDEPPTSNVPRIIPGVTCDPCTTPANPARDAAPTCTDCRPLMGSLVAPLANADKSTKRRRFFTWPLSRDAKSPLTLPQEDEPSPCMPKIDLPSSVIPKSLPQPLPVEELPQKLPTKTSELAPDVTFPKMQASERKNVPLPTIIDGPVETKKPTPRAAAPTPAPTPEIIIPVAASRIAPNQPLPVIVEGPAPRESPVRAAPRALPQEVESQLTPAIAPPLRLQALKSLSKS